jgi:hypothetical protein
MTKRINLKSNLDGRIGLGYGTIRPIFDEPRMSSSTWPYSSIQQEEMPPMFAPDEEVEFDELSARVFQRILKNVVPTDNYAVKGSDPFYFAGAATKISEELNPINSIAPFPRMYKKRTGSGFGGAGEALPFPGPTYGFRSISRPTGTKKGWSQAIPHPEENNREDFNLKSMSNDPEQEYPELRHIIRMLLLQDDT